MSPRVLVGLCAAGLAAALAGCNIAGPAAFAIAGPGKVRLEHELDPAAATVIFVDDPSNRVANRRLRANIGSAAEDVMLRRKVVREGAMISARSALAAAAQGTHSEPLAITEIGEALGADVVIWVLMTRFTLSPDGQTLQPSAGMRVSVVDVASREQVWPADAEGFPLTVDFPTRAEYVGQSDTRSVREEQQALADRAGLAIAQLFHTVEIPQSVRR